MGNKYFLLVNNDNVNLIEALPRTHQYKIRVIINLNKNSCCKLHIEKWQCIAHIVHFVLNV